MTSPIFECALDYFTADEDKIQCKLCASTSKCNKTYNLKRHLKMKHQIETNENSQNFSKIKVALNKHMLLQSCIGLITEEGYPLRILDSPNLRRIINPICEVLEKQIVNT